MNQRNTILLIAFVVYTICAVCNNGFYYFDEHYQLIEFAELKAGRNLPSDLSWEYAERVRSAVQPTIAYFFISCLRTIGVTDSYNLAMLLRFFSGIGALFCLNYFITKTEHLINPDLRNCYYALTFFIAFAPFINVRFSSESCAGLAFLLGLSQSFSDTKNRSFFLGCFLGLSFLFRFQTAIMSFGLIAWLMVIKRANVGDLVKLSLGGICVIAVGICSDYWFYGRLTCTFYNYFVSNIIHNVASNYGVSPWYFYFKQFAQIVTAPIAIVVWLCVLYQVTFHRTSFVTWILCPFLLTHILIPHKELRFLFPIINLLPISIAFALQDLLELKFMKSKRARLILRVPFAILILVNGGCLIFAMFCPADNKGRMNITKEIHYHYKNKPVVLWTLDVSNPYKPIPPRQRFYEDRNVSIASIDTFIAKKVRRDVTNLVVANTEDGDNFEYFVIPYRMKKVATGIPSWIVAAKGFLGYEDKSLSLYELTK